MSSAPKQIEVHVQDLNAPPAFELKADYILMLDVIEHLVSPEKFLDALRKKFDSHPRRLVLTTPNVAFRYRAGPCREHEVISEPGAG